jgi:hypothetical protein
MEILKSSLKQVPENERVKGRVYGVSDDLEGKLEVAALFESGNTSMYSTHWSFWFELPESMLPVRMPEVGKDYEFDSPSFKGLRGTLIGFEFELKGGGTILKVDHIRPIPTNPAQSLTIPAGTKAEQLEYLRKILAEMEG